MIDLAIIFIIFGIPAFAMWYEAGLPRPQWLIRSRDDEWKALADRAAATVIAQHEEKQSAPKQPALSSVADWVHNEYIKIPAAERPMDIMPILRALDIKYADVTPKHGHTYTRVYEGSGWYRSTLCKVHGRKAAELSTAKEYKPIDESCPYKSGEYFDLHESMTDFLVAHREREKALRMAEVKPDLDDAAVLTERLRDEARIAREVTKEIA